MWYNTSDFMALYRLLMVFVVFGLLKMRLWVFGFRCFWTLCMLESGLSQVREAAGGGKKCERVVDPSPARLPPPLFHVKRLVCGVMLAGSPACGHCQ